ncbi:MAG: ABC transporter permease [Phycisphaerales bacterium]|nr:ABC transporter permease [Phycisphaerales bacterium]
MNLIAQPIIRLGSLVHDGVDGFGRFTRFTGNVLYWIVSQPSSWMRWRNLAPQLYAVGVLSIPVVAITGMFIGMILALEGFAQFASLGQEDRIGGVINASVTKQIGPVLAAVMLSGRVGGALAAELGTMKVTEQLDALRAMGSDPIRVLVVPRFIACLVMTPILTVYSDILGSWGAWLVVVRIFEVPSADYWFHTANFVTWWEPVGGLAKSVFFGACIGLAACYKGFYCRPGAAGVGRAATAAFVSSFIAIIMINLVLAHFLNTFRQIVDPNETSFFF